MALTLNGSTGIVVADGATIGSTSGTDAITLPSTGRITFNQAILAQAGIQPNANSFTSAEVLDDYEEGSFTPVFGGSGGNPTVTHSLQFGTYVKVGKIVYINISIGASGTPSGGSGDLIITGLPFTSKSGVQQAGSIAFANNMSFGSGTTDGFCNIEGGVAYLNVDAQEYDGTSAMGRCPTSGLHNSNPRIVCSIVYEVA